LPRPRKVVQPGRKEGFRKHNIVEEEGACLISCHACLWRRTLSAAAAAMALVSTVGATKMLIGLEGAHASGVSTFEEVRNEGRRGVV